MDTADVFRTEWPKLVAVLVRDFGDLGLAEDCAQEAFVEASIRWPEDGLPDRPGAWLTTTARRKALDRVRRTASYKTKLAELEARAKRGPTRSDGAFVDDQLALLLGCCHPALSTEAQVALTLRIVAGLTTAQIARAFLVEEGTMGRRLTRAKTKIREANIPFREVDRSVLDERLDSVRQIVYLIFTEGYASGSDGEFVRGDLCDEAAWLASLLVSLVPEDSESHALLALILLTDARRSTRVDEDGVPVLLEHQDRAEWDRTKIAEGLRQLERAASSGLGPYGLQSTVASFHAVSPTFEDTDWTRIVAVYDRMLDEGGSAVVALNRAAALSYVDGPGAGLAAMKGLAEELDAYLYFHSARAELLRRLDLTEDAREAYERALECHPAEAEAAFLHRQLDSL